MAVRASLGATRWRVVGQLLVEIAVGLALGFLGALGVGQILQGGFVSTSPHDPITLGVAMAVLVGVAVVACLVPVRRASQLDPVNALRWE
jgi:ABC-type antimicrobial peptide transport system permease subunit